jgi:hypothetical protein
MTLNEIAYNLLNLMRGGMSNHDESISLEQIKFNILHYRAVFIRRDYAKNGFSSRHTEQDLGCLELEPIDAKKCCGLDLETSCLVYRTKQSIPRTVRYNFREALTHVGDITGLGTIPLINSNTVKWLSYDKYTKEKYKAYMIEDYLYIYNADGLKYVNVRGVFENPRDVAAFTTNCKIEGPPYPCYDDASSNFPMPMDMVQTVNQGIINGELKLLVGTTSDTLNDRNQDPGSMPATDNKAS